MNIDPSPVPSDKNIKSLTKKSSSLHEVLRSASKEGLSYPDIEKFEPFGESPEPESLMIPNKEFV